MVHKDYLDTRARSVDLCLPLKAEDYIPQPVEFVSPPKWHLAHTTWFFEEMILKNYAKGYVVFDDSFGYFFNSYYNFVGPRTQRNQRGLITRPGVDEVYEYRKHVDAGIEKLLKVPQSKEVLDLMILGINHEQQHQELLITDLKYTLALNPLYPVYDKDSDLSNDRNEESGWVNISEGIGEIGYKGSTFYYDNEKAVHKVYLNNFEISKSLVTNGEFIKFIEDGGYKTFSYWLDEGWSWLQSNDIGKPLYWRLVDGVWHQFTLAGLKPIDPEAILCHVSFYEANAFATWKGNRLPTEFEWEIASEKFKWGTRWEWTNSAYLPYPKFKIEEGAVGEYNGKFMVNQMVLRGASIVTASGHSRKTYRNFFHPKYQWQYSGIRLARDND